MGHPSSRIMGKSHFLGENQGKSNLRIGKTSEIPVFDSTIMGNPNFHGIIKGHSNFWCEKSREMDWIPSGSVLPPTIFGGFRCDQDPDSSNAAWYYANFSNYFIAAGTETCGLELPQKTAVLFFEKSSVNANFFPPHLIRYNKACKAKWQRLKKNPGSRFRFASLWMGHVQEECWPRMNFYFGALVPEVGHHFLLYPALINLPQSQQLRDWLGQKRPEICQYLDIVYTSLMVYLDSFPIQVSQCSHWGTTCSDPWGLDLTLWDDDDHLHHLASGLRTAGVALRRGGGPDHHRGGRVPTHGRGRGPFMATMVKIAM